MVSNVGRSLDDYSIPSSQRAASEDLGQEDFLKLMVEQMRNQNPLEPQDNSEFFSQIAQFQTLDAMNVISDAITTLVEISGLSNASSLIGRSVIASVPQSADPDTGFPRPDKEVTGVVDRVSFDENGAVLHIGGLTVPASLVTEISDAAEGTPAASAVADTTADVVAELLAQLEALGVFGLGSGEPTAETAAGTDPAGDVAATDVAAADAVAESSTEESAA
jgi:flagellar basal-body rod modification protein FlgD